jgi:glycosyltransferase involved in cell wall biosynthesis
MTPDGDRTQHIVINGWFLGRTSSGSGQYLHHLLDQLPRLTAGRAAPTRWTVLAPRAIHAQPPGAGWPHVVVAPLALRAGPPQLAKLYWEQVMMPRWARRLQADLLWVPYFAAPLVQPVPTVVTVHDLIPLLLPDYNEGVAQRAYNAVVTASARRARSILTVSHAAARDIVEHLHVSAESVHVVHHGPNEAPTAEATSAAHRAHVRARYALPDRYFLYLGPFDARKNLRTILAAFKRFRDKGGDPDIHLVIAGRLPQRDLPMTPDPRPMAATLGLSDRVHFTGWVDEADKAALYALSIGTLFPSLYEGFGMMVLEAQQAGAPLITSANGS